MKENFTKDCQNRRNWEPKTLPLMNADDIDQEGSPISPELPNNPN
jgi:hypothetical protein